jgi:hypothetical protein
MLLRQTGLFHNLRETRQKAANVPFSAEAIEEQMVEER